jgi:hypothetical protein
MAWVITLGAAFALTGSLGRRFALRLRR